MKLDWEIKSQSMVYEVTEQSVADVVAMMTGIPVNQIAEAELRDWLRWKSI